MRTWFRNPWAVATATAMAALSIPSALASEADLNLPSLGGMYSLFGLTMSGTAILSAGIVVCLLGMLFGLYEFMAIRKLPAHRAMLDVSHLIYETCKTYLYQQGKLLLVLELFIGSAIVYYFFGLQHMEVPKVALILF